MTRLFIHTFFRKHFFIPLCAVAFFSTGLLLIGSSGQPGWIRGVLILVSTFLVYHLNSADTLKRIRQAPHPGNIRSCRWTCLLFVLLAITILYCSMFISRGERLILGAMALLSVLYNPPVRRFYFIPLRGIPFLKVFLISLVWAVLGSIYPWSVEGFTADPAIVWRQFAGMFLFVLGITLPFDIRDFESDRSGGLPTVAHVFSIKTTKAISVAAIILAGIVLWPLYGTKVYLVLLLLLTSALAYGAGPGRHPLYFQGLLDGTMPALYLATMLSL